MSLLILGLALFLGAHAFTMARGPRGALVARLGLGPYKGLYSLVALAGLALVAIGYGGYRAAGPDPLWSPPEWTHHLALLLVWLAFVTVAAAYLPGRIKRALKHPMLVGVKLWASAHLLANGDLGSILLFGSMLVWAVAARISLKRRPVDLAAQHGGEAAPAGLRNDALAIGVGTLAYLAFAIWLHPWWIGVPVWPGR